jgi:hypothetical protein
LANPDDPVLDKLVEGSTLFKSANIKDGKDLFEKIEGARIGDLGKYLVNGVDTKGMSIAEISELPKLIFDASRKFFIDQYQTIEGQDVNFFEYIMFAPTLKFNLEDQIAILNSFYFDLGDINPSTSKSYWDDDSGWKANEFCFGRKSKESCSPKAISAYVQAVGR